MTTRTDIAWKNLTHDPRRLAVTIAGVGFAVLLIFMELGFLNGLLESTVRILQLLKGDIVILSSARITLPGSERFPRQRMYEASSVPGVEHVSPLYMEILQSVLRVPGSKGYPIRVIAFRREDDVLNIPEVRQFREQLARPRTAIVDRASRPKFHIPETSTGLSNFQAELAGQRLELVGHFHLGVDFANDGNLLMTAENLATYLPQRARGQHPLDVVDLAVVKVRTGFNPKQVRDQLRRRLSSDVSVLLREDLIEREKQFWRNSAPVGFIFTVGAFMGFIVGIVICYQIIYADIADHMTEFATLKAMGYSKLFFMQLVLRESAYLTMMGFVPGAVVSFISYRILSAVTGLTIGMTLSLALTVFVVTVVMCAISGLIALRKLLAVDPAELF